MKEEIKLINKIVLNAIMNGADAGGSYELVSILNEWIHYKGLEQEYIVIKAEDSGWETFKIMRR